ncbi:hypothetical protein [Tunicatimonas pelagia]|uniref:hypothetical protein n=1 Tax=Tunicatimonas pelagia TaxID=931531 RepID=UPI0026659941|nr:hypothetical protein [Tunicatimonas pelagia]WKN46283.1 hypothetical protein P0M28_15135 [Tunicatimonas pelagia]
MKVLTFLMGIFLLAACQDEDSSGGEPAVYFDYFVVENIDTGEDIFLSSNMYNPDSLQFLVKNIDSQLTLLGNIPYIETDSAVIFGPLDFHEFNLLDFREGDVDSVEHIRVCGTTQGERDCSILYKSTFYYNGALVDEFDFEDNEDLFLELVRFNGSQSNSPNENTYIFTFKKEIEE